jgi:hypothetical protein
MSKPAVIVAVASVIGGPTAAAGASVERPPQFVMMAFDNCTELDRWENLTSFVRTMEASNIPVRFTFFVSAVNFLTEEKKDLYKGPHHARGKSNIDFGGTRDEVSRRIAFINGLRAAGSEIGSHTVGHFDGGVEKWTAVDWRYEFQSYKDMFLNAARNDGLPSDVKFNFAFDEVVGFRAPYLSTTGGMYTVLSESKFRYDTSSDDEPTAWPKKKDGIWRFNLADLEIAGTRKKTLSMDYNFFATQSNAEEDPNNYERYRQQMLDTYMAYFKTNYSGNRAPINIGHHFAPYQGGVYHQALQAFARSVCGLPEVRCVTYTQLADFMDQLSQPTLSAYQSGDFPHADDPGIALAGAFANAPPSVAIKVGSSRTLHASLVGANKDGYRGGDFTWLVDGRKIGKGETIAAARLPKGRTAPLTAVYQAPDGLDALRATQRVRVAKQHVHLIAQHAELKSRLLKE